jgi:hypothetical protein
MAGKLKAPGTMRIEDVSYQLLPSESGQGWSYEYKTISTTPQQTSPEEQLLGSSPVGYKRTVGWLDWTQGGVGPDVYQPNVRYLSYSEGPQTELAKKITRPLAKRRMPVITSKGRVVDFFEFYFHDGTIGTYLVQENGVVRRVYTTLNAETLATQVASEGTSAGSNLGVNMGTRKFTEASPPWTYTDDGGVTNKTAILIGSLANSLVRCYEGSSAGSLTWQQDAAESSGGTNHNAIQMTHFTNGVYSSSTSGGEYLWASTAPGFIPNVGGTRTKQAIWPLIQEQDPFVWDNWVAQIGALNLDPELHYITGIASLREYIIVTTNAGTIYQVGTGDTGGVPSPILDRRGAIPDPDSGRSMRVWNGRLFIPTAKGLYMWVEFNGQQGGTLVAVGPESIPGNNGPARGKCVLYTGDNDWLYASFWNGTDSYVMKGRLPESNEQTDFRMIWHAACPFIEDEQVTALHVTSPNAGTNPILLIGTQSNASSGASTPAVHSVTMPRPGYTVLTDENLLFDIAGEYSAVLPDHDALLSNVKKTFMRVTLSSHNVSKNNPIIVYAKLDDGNWTRAGTLQESPIASIPLPRNFNGYKIGLKLVWSSFTNATTSYTDNVTCSYIQAVSVEFVPHLPPAKVATCSVFVAQNQITISGHNQYGGQSRLTALENFKDSNRLLDFIGPDGIERVGQFDKTEGITWVWSDQATPDLLAGFKAQFKLNIYDDFVFQTGAIYEVSQYTEGTTVSYYDETG